MAKRELLLSLLVLFGSGCSALGGRVYKSYSASGQTYALILSENQLGTCDRTARPQLNVDLIAIRNLRGSEPISMRIAYLSEMRLSIVGGKSLALDVDGESIEFQTTETPGRKESYYGDDPIEVAYYDVTLDQIEKIANAQSVSVQLNVRIRGKSYRAKRCFTERNLKNFKKFVSEYRIILQIGGGHLEGLQTGVQVRRSCRSRKEPI